MAREVAAGPDMQAHRGDAVATPPPPPPSPGLDMLEPLSKALSGEGVGVGVGCFGGAMGSSSSSEHPLFRSPLAPPPPLAGLLVTLVGYAEMHHAQGSLHRAAHTSLECGGGVMSAAEQKTPCSPHAAAARWCALRRSLRASLHSLLQLRAGEEEEEANGGCGETNPKKNPKKLGEGQPPPEIPEGKPPLPVATPRGGGGGRSQRRLWRDQPKEESEEAGGRPAPSGDP
eukprot:TRINITY_DN5556_c0_g1_i1.p2 TRINITY_DN5556_c0_g1~~TRINITY_DN5556_c0_g1_i1.p2  ORF type:complete len:250 (+),score=40.99 TRINITY_DN5556_c0_g1_i1:66-752(+)